MWMASKSRTLTPADQNPGDIVNCDDFKDSDKLTIDWARANTLCKRYSVFGDVADLDRGNKVPGPASPIPRNAINEDGYVGGIVGAV